MCRRTVACEHLSKLENLEVGDDLAEVEKAKAEFEEFGTPYDENQLYAQAKRRRGEAAQVVKRKSSEDSPGSRVVVVHHRDVKLTKTIWLSLLHPSPFANHLARISSAGRALRRPRRAAAAARPRINAFASPRYPIASATLTIPVTMAVNCPSASSGSPVSGLRARASTSAFFIVIPLPSSSRAVGCAARDRGRDRETPRPRVIASLGVGAGAMASRVEVSRWTRFVTLIPPRDDVPRCRKRRRPP